MIAMWRKILEIIQKAVATTGKLHIFLRLTMITRGTTLAIQSRRMGNARWVSRFYFLGGNHEFRRAPATFKATKRQQFTALSLVMSILCQNMSKFYSFTIGPIFWLRDFVRYCSRLVRIVLSHRIAIAIPFLRCISTVRCCLQRLRLHVFIYLSKAPKIASFFFDWLKVGRLYPT